MKKKNLSKIELLEQKIQKVEKNRYKLQKKRDENKLDRVGSKLGDFCFSGIPMVLYASLVIPMAAPVLGFVASNMVAPAIAVAVVACGWWPSLLGVSGIFKLCAKIQQKRLSKKLCKIGNKIFKLEKALQTTDILSNFEILNSNTETLFLSTEDGFRVVKEKYREAKKETKAKIKDAKKKTRILKKYEVLRQSQIKLSGKLNIVKEDNFNKKSTMIKSDRERKEREL